MYDMVIISLPDGTIVYANEAALAFYGCGAEEMSLIRFDQIDTKAELNRITAETLKRLWHGAEFETVHRKKDGTSVPVKVRTVAVGGGGVVDSCSNNEGDVECMSDCLCTEKCSKVYIINVIQDMTELEKNEKRLMDQQKRAQLALEGSDFGILEYNYSTKKVYFYNQLPQWLGYDENELGNDFKNWLNCIDPTDGQYVISSFEKLVEKGKTLVVEFRVLPKYELEYRWLRLKGKIFDCNEDGTPKRLVGSYEDITEKKKDELEQKRKSRELELLVEEAQKANRAKDLFLANISHEIRTPLNGINIATQLLLRDENNKKNRSLLEMLQCSNESLKKLVTDILDLSKAEQDGVKLSNVKFVLRDMIQELFRDLQISANQKGLEASCFIDPLMEGEYIGDFQKMKQVLANLFSNALKFTEEGMIGIRAKIVEVTDNDACVEFRIRDTGIGIGEEFQPHMFDAFSMEEDSYDKKYGGTGLGLAICRKYSEAMGGSLSYEGDRDKGSTFIFKCRLLRSVVEGIGRKAGIDRGLIEAVSSRTSMVTFAPGPVMHSATVAELKLQPQAAAEPVPMHEQHPKQNPPSMSAQLSVSVEGARVLSVDDNNVNQDLIKRVLERYKVQLTTAYSPDEALELLADAENKFDLILMDIQMPHMNGYLLTSKIRESERISLSNIPIIAMTAYSRFEDKEKCLRAGMDDYISKPIDIELLIDKISSILKKND